jgi:hypothetical protein
MFAETFMSYRLLCTSISSPRTVYPFWLVLFKQRMEPTMQPAGYRKVICIETQIVQPDK